MLICFWHTKQKSLSLGRLFDAAQPCHGYVSSQCSRCCLRIQSWLRIKGHPKFSNVPGVVTGRSLIWSPGNVLPASLPLADWSQTIWGRRYSLNHESLGWFWRKGKSYAEKVHIFHVSDFFPSTNAGVQARLTFSNDDSDPATRDNTSSAMIGVN